MSFLARLLRLEKRAPGPPPPKIKLLFGEVTDGELAELLDELARLSIHEDLAGRNDMAADIAEATSKTIEKETGTRVVFGAGGADIDDLERAAVLRPVLEKWRRQAEARQDEKGAVEQKRLAALEKDVPIVKQVAEKVFGPAEEVEVEAAPATDSLTSSVEELPETVAVDYEEGSDDEWRAALPEGFARFRRIN